MSQRPLRVVRGEGLEEPPLIPAEALDFDDFFASESERLFRRLWLVTRNRAEAEEVMQDAFLSLYERWDRMADVDDPKAYLYRTAFNAWNRRLAPRSACFACKPDALQKGRRRGRGRAHGDR